MLLKDLCIFKTNHQYITSISSLSMVTLSQRLSFNLTFMTVVLSLTVGAMGLLWSMIVAFPGFNVSYNTIAYKTDLFCLFDLILYIPINIFQLCPDGVSCVEPVLSRD